MSGYNNVPTIRHHQPNYWRYAGYGGGVGTAGYVASKVAPTIGKMLYSQLPSWNKAKMDATQAYNYWQKQKQNATKTKAKAKTNVNMGKKVVTHSNRSLSETVQRLKQKLDNDTGTNITRYRVTGRCKNDENRNAHVEANGSDSALMETTLASLQYYDIQNPATLKTASGATGTFSNKFLFEQVRSSCTVRNNYQIPVKVTLYCVVPKSDTSISALTAYTNGITDISGPSSLLSLVYLTDSPVFKNLWKIKTSRSRVLYSGQEMTLSYNVKDVLYDVAYHDAHTSSYQPKDGTHRWIIRTEGVLSHDATYANDDQGFSESAVDYYVDTKYVIKYNALGDITTLTVSDASDTSVTTYVTGFKQDTGNKAYTVGV